MNITTIREELAALCESVDGVRKAFAYGPDSHSNPPVVVVDTPSMDHISMGAGVGSGAAVELTFPVFLLVARQVDRAATVLMDELVLAVWSVLNAGGTLNSAVDHFYTPGWRAFDADEFAAYAHIGVRFEVEVVARV